MLSETENTTLMQVGPGTPMGDLLRYYWMPIAAVAEIEDNPIKPVRLMGEDLVLYRDSSGTYGSSTGTALTVAPTLLRLGRRLWPALQLPRLEVRPRRPVHRTALRGDRAPGGELQGPNQHQALQGGGQSRPDLGLHGPRPGATLPHLGALHLGERLRPNRLLRRSPATGCNARKTASTRCTSNGCTPTGRCPIKGAREGKKIPTHLKVGFDEFE